MGGTLFEVGVTFFLLVGATARAGVTGESWARGHPTRGRPGGFPGVTQMFR
jgi:hypothetical protein